MSPRSTPPSAAPRLLSQSLGEARRQLAAHQPAPAQHAAVLQRLTQLQRAQQLQAAHPLATAGGREPVLRRAAWGGAWLAGGLLLLAGLLLSIEPPALERGRPSAWVGAAADSGFLPVVSQEEWQRTLGRDPQAAVWLMPAELPRERLALLGLPFDATRADQRVRAELMVHPGSGQLLAVRFVQ